MYISVDSKDQFTSPPATGSAKYRAHTNIALIKYWGKRNEALFLPETSSLSLTLDAFYTDTQVIFSPELKEDTFYLNGQLQTQQATQKVTQFVNLFRHKADRRVPFLIESYNHVPTAAGLASSASAFAALSAACNAALELNMEPTELSTYARRGSGSATRSLFGGFVEWHRGFDDNSESSYAEPFDPADWDVAMLVVMVNQQEKDLSSREGMELTRRTSPFYQLWPQEVEKDLQTIKEAIRRQDFETMGEVAEHNAMKMHATMIAANPSFTYWQPDSLDVMNHVRHLRRQGIPCYFTMDAGPNVKILCRQSQADQIQDYFKQFYSKDQLCLALPGSAPHVI